MQAARIALALVVLAALLFLRRSGRLAMGPRAIGATAALVGVAGFLLVAALVPYDIQY